MMWYYSAVLHYGWGASNLSVRLFAVHVESKKIGQLDNRWKEVGGR